MRKFVYSLLLFSTLGFSQIEKEVGDFNKVTTFDQIDVRLIPFLWFSQQVDEV